MSDVVAGGRVPPDVSDDERTDDERTDGAGTDGAGTDGAGTDGPPPPNWIVAYALGLVASDLHGTGVDELVANAGGDPAALNAARNHLEQGMAVGDERLRSGAAELLEAAIAHAALPTGGERDHLVVLDPRGSGVHPEGGELASR